MTQKQNRQQKIHLPIALTISGICLFAPLQNTISIITLRWLTVCSLVISYFLFTRFILQQHKNKHQVENLIQEIQQDETLIIYASQTGYAEQLATQTQGSLQQAGMPSRLCNIQHLSAELLQQTRRALFIVSTTGEGDAPDSAAKFTRTIMCETQPLTKLHYAILGLGDRNYQAFCAFGHQLDHWLHLQGAQSLFDTVEVDNGDVGALRHWQRQLGVISGHTELADWHSPEYENWTLTARELLNPDSIGNPVYRILLSSSKTNTWQAGDIAEILPQRPGLQAEQALQTHREYSIASIPPDGAVELIVRQMHQADGSLGLGSGWLTHHAEIGATVALRLRSNRSFHAPASHCPLILIGNGTGIAGLRAHLKQCELEGRKHNWLFFGERNRTKDFFCETEIQAWQKNGILSKLDLAFSRDQQERIYVQDKLREQASELQSWVQQGAAIYVCGSLEGMAGGVDTALREILGEEKLEQIREDGLYRRDVY